MVNYYERKKVSGTANTETTANIVTSTEEEPKTIHTLTIREVTGTLQGDATIIVYVEREKLVNIKLVSLLEASNSDNVAEKGKVELDLELPVGQDLTVGHVSGATASDIEFMVKYTIT